VDEPLNRIEADKLRPGADTLEKINATMI
jgi:hypothetical protein